MRLNIIKDSKLRLPRRKLKALAEIIGAAERAPDSAEVNVIVTHDAQIRSLNKMYRHIDKTTDVLSFPLERDERSAVIGEIYISETRAQSQARDFAHSVSTEILRLTCHGLFHILGYDHDTDETGDDMEARERRALEKLKSRFGHGRK